MIIEKSDGTQIKVLVSASPLFDSKGAVASVIAIFEDVTDLKRTQYLLKESEEKFRTILENSRDFICMTDLKTGKYIYFSPSIEEMTGFTTEEYNNISTEQLYERVHPDERKVFINKAKLMEAGIETYANITYRWKIKNGEYRWFESRRNLIPDENGQPITYVGIYRDITEQKEYEENLALQAKILSNVNDTIIKVDENDRITYYNIAFVKLFGWQEQEVAGHSVSDISRGYFDEISKGKILWILEEMHKAYSTTDEKHLDEIICHSKDGTRLIVDINTTVVKGPKGEYKGFILSIRDVRERYKYELKLKKSEEKYRYLFNSIDEGFVILEVIFGQENKPKDLRFIGLNSAYEKQTGKK